VEVLVLRNHRIYREKNTTKTEMGEI